MLIDILPTALSMFTSLPGEDGRSAVTNLGDPDAINCYRSVTGRAKQARPQDATSSSAFQSVL
jgi:hypothetical protein